MMRYAKYIGLGLEMGSAMLIGLFGGRYLDGRFGTAPWFMVIGSFLGIIGVFVAVIKLLKQDERGE